MRTTPAATRTPGECARAYAETERGHVAYELRRRFDEQVLAPAAAVGVVLRPLGVTRSPCPGAVVAPEVAVTALVPDALGRRFGETPSLGAGADARLRVLRRGGVRCDLAMLVTGAAGPGRCERAVVGGVADPTAGWVLWTELARA